MLTFAELGEVPQVAGAVRAGHVGRKFFCGVNFQDIQESRLISVFGRANYNLNDKYLLAVSVRRLD